MNQVFDIKRFTLLARLKFSLHKNALGLSIAGYYALLFIIGFFIAYAHRNDASASFEGFHYVCMGLMMILGGVVLAGRAFQDMNTSEKSNFQIMTPASNLEKLILPLISTSIGWLLFSYISYVIFALLFNGIWSAAFGIHFEFFAGTEMFKIEYFCSLNSPLLYKKANKGISITRKVFRINFVTVATSNVLGLLNC